MIQSVSRKSGIVDFAFEFKSRAAGQELAIELMTPEFNYFDGAIKPGRNIPESLIDYLNTPELSVEDILSVSSFIAPYFNGVNQERIKSLLATCA